jgi:enamine deaminase RidA (YjgF/YER057c/UK114 family)
VRPRILNPEALGVPRGWNHGVLAPEGGRLLFVAGQTAGTTEAGRVAGDFAAQFEQALEKVLLVVHEAGGRPEEICRLTVYVTDLEAYRAARGRLGEVWRRLMGRHYPAMALLEVRRLADEGALVELEATAVVEVGKATEGSIQSRRHAT